jgi:polysaccharide export outer membrane protein
MPKYSLHSLIIILLLASSCAYKEDRALFEGYDTGAAPAATDSAHAVYRIKTGDLLSVKNMQQLKYIIGDSPGVQTTPAAGADDQTYLVEPDGTIGLPAIGNVQVAGLTRFAAEQQIAQLYSKALIKNPIIQVRVINLKVSVFGEVRTPGNYPLSQDQTSLTDILGAAGGLTDKADEKKIRIVRGDKRHHRSFEVDLGQLASLSDTSVFLENGDIIYVPRNKRAVRNDHLTTFSTTIQPILIVLNTVLIIFTLSKK